MAPSVQGWWVLREDKGPLETARLCQGGVVAEEQQFFAFGPHEHLCGCSLGTITVLSITEHTLQAVYDYIHA